MAPLQRRALYSLIIGFVLAVALVTVLVLKGATSFDTEGSVRSVLYAALVGVPLVYLILVNLTLRRPTQVDERDKLIVERSVRAQWLAVIFSLAAWTITLTEIYRDEGQVPVMFLNLIFVSVLIISTLAQSLGVLIGYWSMQRNA